MKQIEKSRRDKSMSKNGGRKKGELEEFEGGGLLREMLLMSKLGDIKRTLFYCYWMWKDN